MGRCERGESVEFLCRDALRAMVVGDRLYHRIRQAPETEQVSTYLRMRCADYRGFRILERHTLVQRELHRTPQLIGQFSPEHPIADVVQQPREQRVVAEAGI